MNSPADPDDSALARLARDGSAAAFGTLVHRYHGRVFAFLLTLTRQREDAEDLTQETFLRAWVKFRHYHEIGELLRSQKPAMPPPPALEARIIRALSQAKQRQPLSRWWPWLLLPPALAAAVTLLCWQPPAAAPAPHLSPAPVTAPGAPNFDRVVALVAAGDPLQAEASALARDAKRASGFLVNCLPSFGAIPE